MGFGIQQITSRKGITMAITGQPRRRTTLFGVLTVVTCVASYLAGHLNGYRLHRAEWNIQHQLTARVYAVPVAPALKSDQAAVSQVLEDVTQQIRESVIPSAWTREESRCTITSNPALKAVVVNADSEVHTAISSILSLVRDDRLGN